MAFDDDAPLFLENVGTVYNAREYRRLFEDLIRGPGIIHDADYEVAAESPAAMQVRVAAGSALVEATTGTEMGYYYVRNVGYVDVTIDTAHASNPRYDRVVILVRDTEHDGGSDDDVSLFVVKGTAASSPSEPALPDNCLELARVRVNAAVSTITSDKIVDRRITTPRETLEESALTWSARTTDGDLTNWDIPAVPYATLIRPHVTFNLNPEDSVSWDAVIEVHTASGGGGTVLGRGTFRNGNGGAGTNARVQVDVDCTELAVAADTTKTLYLYVNYLTDTPTSGFTASSIGDNVARTRVRPDPA